MDADERWQSIEASKDLMRENREVLAANEQAFRDLRAYLSQATTALGAMGPSPGSA